jgi:DNA-binding CsgD family transcriptional regulator
LSNTSQTFNQLLIKALTHASDASDFCKHLVLSILTGYEARAAAILRLGALESMTTIGAFGDFRIDEPEFWSTSKTAWARAIRENRPVIVPAEDEDRQYFALPLSQNGLVSGALALNCGRDLLKMLETLDDELVSLKLAAEFYLYEYKFSGARGVRKATANLDAPKDLSARQAEVLRWMATEKPYSQISRELHVSESLVKQEAIKIFRFLGAGNRVEAVRKACEVGLLQLD